MREWRALSQRGVQQCCIVCMNVDNRKEINDTYGRDEFLIARPGADLAMGQAVVKRVRDGLVSSPLPTGRIGAAIRATASFGLALLNPDVSVQVSIERTDPALLLAKAAGRNRATSWDPCVTTGTRLQRLEIDLPD